jgi:hypothetical protein
MPGVAVDESVLGGELADEAGGLGESDPESARDLFGRESASAELADAVAGGLVNHERT